MAIDNQQSVRLTYNSIHFPGASMQSNDPYVIDGKIIRAIMKCKESEAFIDILVDPAFKEDFLKLIETPLIVEDSPDFDLRQEFRTTYAMVKQQMVGNTELEPNLLNTAHRFLQFMLSNELKLNGIESVKSFKSAVFQVLDTYNPDLRAEIIDKFNALVEA
jgi:hypothetical protein